MRQSIRYLRKGVIETIEALDPKESLLDHLRLVKHATGTKEGCNEGDCGACTVVLGRLKDGVLRYEPVNACVTLTGMVDGCELVAIEDLAEGKVLHPVQQAMVDHHGSQCGFCTPGIVMSLFALYQEGMRPVSRQAVTDQLAGNLCRCTGYRPIIDAALSACADPPRDAFALARAATLRSLSVLDDGADVFVGDEQRFFAAPVSVDTLARLYLLHPDATLVGGATDVGLWITKQLRDLKKIIWLGRVSKLDRLTVSADGVSMGATVTLARAHHALAGIDPDLGELMRRFGSTQVRASGTVGGNIANGSPIGDLAPALIALGAKLYLRHGDEGRSLLLEDFFVAYGKQDRLAGEFVVGLAVARLRPGDAFRCYKISKRFDEDISAVMGAFKFTLGEGPHRRRPGRLRRHGADAEARPADGGGAGRHRSRR